VPSRQATLKSTADPLLRAAIKSLHSCVAPPLAAAPTGRMNIPSHYLTGSNGPVNPAEATATRIYGMFERRLTAGVKSPSAAALDRVDSEGGSRNPSAASHQSIRTPQIGGLTLPYSKRMEI
jgi:hypothetical protein